MRNPRPRTGSREMVSSACAPRLRGLAPSALRRRCFADVFKQASAELRRLSSERSLKSRCRTRAEHQIVRCSLRVAGDAKIGPIADDGLPLSERIAALPGGTAIGSGPSMQATTMSAQSRASTSMRKMAFAFPTPLFCRGSCSCGSQTSKPCVFRKRARSALKRCSARVNSGPAR
jgi:hypothetical protein